MYSLKETYIELCKKYSNDDALIIDYWQIIEKAYSQKSRHYHNLQHLINLFSQLNEVKELITDWETIQFATFYHDIIYNTLKSNNEEKSASLAKTHLTKLAVPNVQIDKCVVFIIATKSHEINTDNDCNLFTDADLSILGYDWIDYELYFNQIRKEYSIYPDIIYNPGRKKVLQHFLSMNRIFKTEHFFNNFENKARYNLTTELEML